MSRTRLVMVGAAVISAAWIQIAESVVGGNCNTDDCSLALLMIVMAYLGFPVVLGILLGSDELTMRERVFGSAATAGVAALSSAVGFLVTMEASDPERIAFATGFAFVVAPVATLIGVPLVVAGHRLASRPDDIEERKRKFAVLFWAVGGILLVAGAMMPWTYVRLNSVRLSDPGTSGSRLGLVVLVLGFIVLILAGTARGELTTQRTYGVWFCSILALLTIAVVWVSPSLHAPVLPSTGSPTTQGSGLYVTFLGALLVMIGAGMATLNRKPTWEQRDQPGT